MKDTLEAFLTKTDEGLEPQLEAPQLEWESLLCPTTVMSILKNTRHRHRVLN